MNTIKYKFTLAVLENKDHYDFGQSEYFKAIYVSMFNEYPNILRLGTEGFYLNPKGCFFNIYEDPDEEDTIDDESIYRFENINIQQTIINFYNYFKDKESYIFRYGEYPVIIYDHLIIFKNEQVHDIFIYTNTEEIPDEILELVHDVKETDEKRWVSYVTSSAQGFSNNIMQVTKPSIDIDTYYNNDLPHQKILDALNSDRSGLILLHGEQGTGKTSYIRHLIYTLKEKTFIILDSSIFNYITDSSFVQLLLENKGAIIILEDCEAMLADRLAGNAQLSTLLNLSDGILGDSFKFKFICTFNAKDTKIDKALLRKGRLMVKYEFKPLTVEKTKALCDSIGKEVETNKSLTLADIFNYNDDNGGEVKEERKIGFSM